LPRSSVSGYVSILDRSARESGGSRRRQGQGQGQGPGTELRPDSVRRRDLDEVNVDPDYEWEDAHSGGESSPAFDGRLKELVQDAKRRLEKDLLRTWPRVRLRVIRP